MTGLLAGIEDAGGRRPARRRGLRRHVGGRDRRGAPRRRQAAAPAAERRSRRRSPRPSAEAAPRPSLRTAARWGWAATSPLAPVATALSAPGGALVRSAMLARAPDTGRTLGRLHAEIERSGARFDGRLRVCCVDKRSGRRVVFGSARRAARQRRRRGDGLVRDPVGLRPGADRRARVRRRRRVERDEPRRRPRPPRDRGAVPGPDGFAAARPLRQAFRVAISVELQILRRRGARVRHVGPDAEAAAGDGHRLHGHGAVGRGAGGRAPPGPCARRRLTGTRSAAGAA